MRLWGVALVLGALLWGGIGCGVKAPPRPPDPTGAPAPQGAPTED